MALFLILEDFTDGAVTLRSGSLVDDATTNVAKLATSGLAAIAYNPVTMAAALRGFVALRGSRPAALSTEGDLSALLLAAGALGGSGGGGLEYFFGASLTQNPAANVYSSWTDMFAAIALLPIGVTPVVTIMENTTVPAGVWNMRLGTLKSPVFITGGVTLLCPAGVTLDNLAVIETGLVVEMSPTVAGSALTFSAMVGADALIVGLAAALINKGTAPLWVTPGGGGTVSVLGINGVPWNAFTPPVITAPLIQGSAGDTIILSEVFSLAQMPADWISGTGTLIYNVPVNEEPTTLSGWTGTTTVTQAQVVYPALAAQYAGSVATPPVPSGGTYNVVRGDELVKVAPTGLGNISVVLPDPAPFQGQTVTVKKTTSNVIDAVDITAVAGLIDGLASYPLPASAYSVLGFRSDGADWWVV